VLEHRSRGRVPLISHPYDDSSACLLRHCDPYDLPKNTINHLTIQRLTTLRMYMQTPVIPTGSESAEGNAPRGSEGQQKARTACPGLEIDSGEV
jgi:hypothetical protein